MSDQAPPRSLQGDGPRGYRVYRRAELIAEYSCPMCAERAFCLCASAAWDRAKREASERGGAISIRTSPTPEQPDGVLLADHRGAGRGSFEFRRSGPAKPPRRARAETIPPPAPAAEPPTSNTPGEGGESST